MCKGALRLVLCNNLLLNNPKSLSLHGIQTTGKLSPQLEVDAVLKCNSLNIIRLGDEVTI